MTGGRRRAAGHAALPAGVLLTGVLLTGVLLTGVLLAGLAVARWGTSAASRPPSATRRRDRRPARGAVAARSPAATNPVAEDAALAERNDRYAG